MLRILSIRNMILIDDIYIEFTNGLCVLTGETGAGKSIILNSLGLVAGNRADYSLRPKNDKITQITAVFSEISNKSLFEKLKNFGIEVDDDIILKRQLTNDGKSKAYINDQLVSLNTLKKIGTYLIEIESQFSEQGLLDSNTHIDVLDEFGDYHELLSKVSNSWVEYKELSNELLEIKKINDRTSHQKELLEYELKELENFNPLHNEYDNLLEKKKILVNTTKIKENIKKVLLNFSNDDNGGIEELLSESISCLEKISDFTSLEVKKICESLESILIDVSEYKNILNSYDIDNDSNTLNLNTIEERIFEYNRLSKKHNCGKNELHKKLLNIKNALQDNSIKDSNLKNKELKLEECKEKFFKYSESVSELRKKNADKLDFLINQELPELKLENSLFKTTISPANNYSKKGNNNITFKIKTNKNTELDEIKKISSGGELCRFALAIKVVSSVNSQMSIVFDEVDSGIGGAVASAVGDRLKRLGTKRQVIVVTHSPQVAALGDLHFKVLKNSSEIKTLTHIIKLNNEDRVNEIARMLSGKEITNEAKLAAIKLLEN